MIAPSPALAALLARYAKIGGVIDYVLLPPIPHHDAAVSFMAHISRTQSLTFDPAKAIATPIDPPRFYGRFYDPATRQLALASGGVFGDDEGYAYAFGSPPYGLQATEAEASELFGAINEQLFGAGALDIVQWSNDWSSYFKPGLEWWGAYLWTVHAPGRGHLVAIGASTTD